MDRRLYGLSWQRVRHPSLWYYPRPPHLPCPPGVWHKPELLCFHLGPPLACRCRHENDATDYEAVVLLDTQQLVHAVASWHFHDDAVEDTAHRRAVPWANADDAADHAGSLPNLPEIPAVEAACHARLVAVVVVLDDHEEVLRRHRTNTPLLHLLAAASCEGGAARDNQDTGNGCHRETGDRTEEGTAPDGAKIRADGRTWCLMSGT